MKPANEHLGADGTPLDPQLYETLRRMVADEDQRFVLSLGGGSAPGLCGNAALIGLLEELGLRERVEMIWGTSAGAIIGGAWASGTPAAEILEQLKRMNARGSVDVAWWEVALAFLGRPFGAELPDALLRGHSFHRAIQRVLRVERFEECEIPFRCIACSDDGNFRRKVLSKGPLVPAISASMSLPGLLVPRDADGRPTTGYFDGGLVEKTPLFSPISEHARSGNGRQLLLLATHYGTEARRMRTARGFLGRFLATIYSLEDQLWEQQHRDANGQPGVNLLVFSPSLGDASSFDFSRVERNYREARAFFEDRLQNARLPLALGCA